VTAEDFSLTRKRESTGSFSLTSLIYVFIDILSTWDDGREGSQGMADDLHGWCSYSQQEGEPSLPFFLMTESPFWGQNFSNPGDRNLE
jgi:hypothetical protein